jgi:hypothetical protein
MASLDGFRVPLQPSRSGSWGSTTERNAVVKAGLMDPTGWDLPNRVPLGYLARQDASGRDNHFAQPSLTPSPNPSLVPVRPFRQRQTGATTDGIQLLDPPSRIQPITRRHDLALGQTRVPILSDGYRYRPYTSTSQS